MAKPISEKAEATAVNNHTGLDDAALEMDSTERKALLRKIDFRLVPWCSLLYTLSFLDRVNIGQAKTAGLFKDLKLTNQSYNIALTVFFVSYVAFEIPSVLALRFLRPNVWTTIIMILWSICMVTMGLVHNAAGLEVARFFLGVCESGLFPSLNVLLSCWYAREQLGVRVAVFFSGATLAGAFGGILAFGIRHMDGVGNKPAWAWIFILGLLTFVFAIPTLWVLPNFLDQSHSFITAEQSRKWQSHLRREQGVSNAVLPFTWAQVAFSLKQWQTYAFALMYIGIAEPLYSLALFTPSIITGLGFTNADANLLTIPPYVLGFLTCLLAAWISDRFAIRSIPIIICMGITAIAYIILLCDVSIGVKYFCLFLAVAGVSPSIALAITFVGGNFGPFYTRAVSMGLFFSTGNASGIPASWVYPTTDSPRYVKGHAVALGFTGMSIVLAALLGYTNYRENQRRDIKYGVRDASGVSALCATSKGEKERLGLSHLSDNEVLALIMHIMPALYSLLEAKAMSFEGMQLSATLLPPPPASVTYSTSFRQIKGLLSFLFGQHQFHIAQFDHRVLW